MPGFHDPAGPVRSALSAEGTPPAGESESAAAGKIPAAAGRVKPSGFSLKQLVHSLKLPRDGLSAALIGFARGFSLPLEPALFARLRKEALTLKARHGGGFVESAALAAAAAAGKGVRLSAEALEQYARAIDPGYAADEPDTSGDGEGQPAGGEGSPFGEQDGNAREDLRDSAGREESIRVIREILEKALRQVRKNGRPDADPPEAESCPACAELAGFLNRLPGRDGNFWMVFPFKIESETLAIHLSVWILLLSGVYPQREFSGQSAGGFSGGITVNAAGGKRRWIFSIKNPGGPMARTRVRVSPPCGETAKKRTEEEIREVLGDFGGTVTMEDGEMPGIRDGDAFFAWPLFFADTGSFSPVEEEA
ncbi:MAG: hypothetical protein LBP80_12055 [Treponema sp.]|nr:hypothetical protein [Treponema sp.]